LTFPSRRKRTASNGLLRTIKYGKELKVELSGLTMAGRKESQK